MAPAITLEGGERERNEKRDVVSSEPKAWTAWTPENYCHEPLSHRRAGAKSQ